jgi:hypothetical protein
MPLGGDEMKRNWHVARMTPQRGYQIVDDDGTIIAQRLKRPDAEFIVYVVNTFQLLAANNRAMAKSLQDCGTTVDRLREFIKAGQLAQITNVIHEAI